MEKLNVMLYVDDVEKAKAFGQKFRNLLLQV